MITEIKKEEIALSALAIKAFFDKETGKLPEGVDYSEVMTEARHQSVLSAAFEGAYMLGVELDDETSMKALRATASIAASNEQLLDLQDEAIKLLESAGIKYCIIKGAAVSVMYNNPSLRTMGDVDIIVSKENYQKAQEIFSANFEIRGEDGKIHSEYARNGKIVELHKSINGLPENEIGKELEELLDKITEAPIYCNFDSHEFMAPDPKTTGIILLLHSYEHLTAGGIGLRHLLDFAAYGEKYLNQNNFPKVSEYISEFKKYGIAEFAANLISCIGLLPGFYDLSGYSWISEFNVTEPRELLRDIFDGGNFGRKKLEERYISEILVKDGGKKRNIFSRMFHNFIQVSKSSMPAVKKYPILYPVAFLYIPIRYLVRVIRGKRTAVNPVKMVRSSKDRYEIYEKFNMFRK